MHTNLFIIIHNNLLLKAFVQKGRTKRAYKKEIDSIYFYRSELIFGRLQLVLT